MESELVEVLDKIADRMLGGEIRLWISEKTTIAAPVQRLVMQICGRLAVCSAALAGWIWDWSEQGLPFDGRWNVMNMQTECCENIGQTCNGGQTCEHGRKQTPNGSTLSAVDSHAKTSATLGSEPESTASGADCGEIICGSFARYDRESSSWKTSQRCLFGGWIEYVETWPRAGTMRSGNVSQRQSLVPLTVATEYSSLPTMRVSMRHGATKGKALKRLGDIRIEDWCFLKSHRDSGIPNPT